MLDRASRLGPMTPRGRTVTAAKPPPVAAFRPAPRGSEPREQQRKHFRRRSKNFRKGRSFCKAKKYMFAAIIASWSIHASILTDCFPAFSGLLRNISAKKMLEFEAFHYESYFRSKNRARTGDKTNRVKEGVGDRLDALLFRPALHF